MTVVRNACLRMLRPFARQRRALGERVSDNNAVPAQQLSAEVALQRWQLVQAVHVS